MSATLAGFAGTAFGFGLGVALSLAGTVLANGAAPMGWHIVMGCVLASASGVAAWAWAKGI